MYRLLETIRFENGQFANLKFHQERMDQSRKDLFNLKSNISLENEIHQSPDFQEFINKEGLYKCRVIYARKIESIQFSPYQIPIIRSLKILSDNKINYPYKYSDRSHLQKLFSKKENCDDILIVKHGFITDTSFANILFFNGKSWVTPSKPLLKGIQRQFLLENEQITTAEIRPTDLKYFKKARLINAMICFRDELDILTVSIFS